MSVKNRVVLDFNGRVTHGSTVDFDYTRTKEKSLNECCSTYTPYGGHVFLFKLCFFLFFYGSFNVTIVSVLKKNTVRIFVHFDVNHTILFKYRVRNDITLVNVLELICKKKKQKFPFCVLGCACVFFCPNFSFRNRVIPRMEYYCNRTACIL